MAGVALADSVAQLAREVWRLNRVLGFSQRLGMDDWGDAGGRLGRLAKACGATPAQVESWMAGESEPTTGQILACLDALPYPELRVLPVPILNGSAHG